MSAETRRKFYRGRDQSGRSTCGRREGWVGLRSLRGIFLRHGDGQREEIDETFGVFRVVARHRKAGEILAIQANWAMCDA